MSLFAYLAGTDRAYAVRLGNMGLTERADGTQGFGGLIFDDPDKTLDVRGWMKVLILETACTSAPYIGSGYIGPRRITRSNGVATYKTGNGRFIDCDIVDENVLLDIRIITDSDGKRPAETHADRINWLLASKYLDQGTDLIDDTTLVDLSNPRPFEEADYRKQYPSNVLEDIDSALARTSFVYTVGTNGQRGLFFDFPDQAVGICTLSISNDLSDITFDANGEITGTVYPPEIDAVQTLDPSEVYAKVLYEYRHGTVTANNSTTFDTFFSDNSLGYRGVAVTNTRIGLESTARLFADNYLTAHSVEKETIVVGVLLPKEKAGLIRAGQFINVKFGHFDNFSGSYRQMRITERVIAHADQTNEKYLLMLELSNRPVSATGPSGGAPGPGDFPHPSTGPLAIVQYAQNSSTGNFVTGGSITATFASPATAGNLLIAYTNLNDSPTNPTTHDTGFTEITNGSDRPFGFTGPGMSIASKIATGGETSITISVASNPQDRAVLQIVELSGATLDTYEKDYPSGTSIALPDITPQQGVNVLILAWLDAFQAQGQTGDPSGYTQLQEAVPNTGSNSNRSTMYSRSVSPSSGTYGGTATYAAGVSVAGLQISFTGADANPPSPGQWVRGEVVTMSGATGTTAFPYADGSLIVRVDGVPISRASYTETDGSTGDFTLSWTPDADEVITVDYQGR